MFQQDAIKKTLKCSLVIPVYAGREYLAALCQRIELEKSAWEKGSISIVLAEAIFVADNPVDDSLAVLTDLAKQYAWIKVINLSKNFGQHQATVAGILYTSGDWVITIDEDLQHPPEQILDMIRKATSTTSDIVYARPIGKVHESYIRDSCSLFIKKSMATILEIDSIKYFNSFRAIRGGVARAAAAVACHGVYFDIVLSWFSLRVSTLEMFLKDERYINNKQSSYTLGRLVRHAIKLVLSSPAKILTFAALIGIACLLVSALTGVWIIYSKFFYPESIKVAGWATTVVWILFFGGMFSFFLSVVLQYLSFLVQQAQGKPAFFVVDRSSDEDFNRQFLAMQNSNGTSKS